MPIREARRINGKQLQIGQVSVALKEEKRPPSEEGRCYRCLERGHKANECKGVDRSKLCYRCESKSHRAADCKQPVICGTCGGKHQIGSKKCSKQQNDAPNEEQDNA
uniref:CCHC-type domain-containing protein n=1 Tax=Anopheles epiroticus TaxID=199890 RepID=A0A182P4D1_9DIPT